MSALIVIEEREQGDQLVARDIVAHMLRTACEAESARCGREIQLKSALPERAVLIEPDTTSAAPAPKDSPHDH